MITTTLSNDTPMTLNGFATQAVGNVITEQIFITEEDKDFIAKCCFVNLVLAGGSEEHQNDKTSILIKTFFELDAINFFLEKKTIGTFNEVAVLNDSTFGTFFGFGTLSNPLLTGFELKWSSVLSEFGEGNYRLRIDRNTLLGSDVIFSINYNLKTFSAELADNTIVIEWIQNGQIIDGLDFTGLNWRQSVRFPGFFGERQTEFEEEIWKDTNFTNVQIRNELTFTYKCEIGVIPSCIGDIIFNLLQANTILITDYNIKNFDYNLIRKPVRLTGIEDTKYDDNRQAVYNLTFSDRKDNHIKINC
ncbi:MAG: hypothetical protein ACUZ8E_12505 [Candidatus Anammoxibacter sp.]